MCQFYEIYTSFCTKFHFLVTHRDNNYSRIMKVLRSFNIIEYNRMECELVNIKRLYSKLNWKRNVTIVDTGGSIKSFSQRVAASLTVTRAAVQHEQTVTSQFLSLFCALLLYCPWQETVPFEDQAPKIRLSLNSFLALNRSVFLNLVKSSLIKTPLNPLFFNFLRAWYKFCRTRNVDNFTIMSRGFVSLGLPTRWLLSVSVKFRSTFSLLVISRMMLSVFSFSLSL